MLGGFKLGFGLCMNDNSYMGASIYFCRPDKLNLVTYCHLNYLRSMFPYRGCLVPRVDSMQFCCVVPFLTTIDPGRPVNQYLLAWGSVTKL